MYYSSHSPSSRHAKECEMRTYGTKLISKLCILHQYLLRVHIIIAFKITALHVILHHQQRHAYYVVLVFVLVLVLVLAYTFNNPVQTSAHPQRTESSRPPPSNSPRSRQTMDCMANAAASAVLRVIKIVARCGCGYHHALLLYVVRKRAALSSYPFSSYPLALSHSK